MHTHDEAPAPSRARSMRKCVSATKSDPKAASSETLVSLFDLDSAPGHLLRRCHSRARAIFDDLIGRETGLSKQQVALMVTIAKKPSATHAQLSEESGFDRNTLADTIDRLIAKGLAIRARSPRDARAYEIGLTKLGRSVLEELIPRSLAVQAKILEPLPEALRSVFIECLQILAGASGPSFDEVSPEPVSARTSSIASSRAKAQKSTAGQSQGESHRTRSMNTAAIRS